MLRTLAVAGVAIRSNRRHLSATRHNLPQAEVLSRERHRKTRISPSFYRAFSWHAVCVRETVRLLK
jgi:hypothetical protein